MKRFKQSEIQSIVTLLKNDGVISVATDTVYGLCARVNSHVAFNKLVEIKNRPLNKNFPIMCSNIEQIKMIAIVNKQAEKLINNFMPGPITLILKKKVDKFSDINNGGDRKTDELAIRMATSSFLKELIDKVGSPLFMTSANKSGEKVCTSLDEIEQTCPSLDGIVEGDISFGQSSTIVDCTDENIKVQRKGPISEKQIINMLNN